MDPQNEFWKGILLISGLSSLFLFLTFFGTDNNNQNEEEANQIKIKKKDGKKTLATPLKTPVHNHLQANNETRSRSSSFIDAALLESPMSENASPSSLRFAPNRTLLIPSPSPQSPPSPLLPTPSLPTHTIPTTLEEALIIIESLKEYATNICSTQQACTNAERRGRLRAERKLEAEKAHTKDLMSEIEIHEQRSNRTVTLQKDLSVLLESAESSLSLIVDKLGHLNISDKPPESNDTDLSLILTIVDTEEALRLEELLKSIQEKKELLEQEIIGVSLQKLSSNKKRTSGIKDFDLEQE